LSSVRHQSRGSVPKGPGQPVLTNAGEYLQWMVAFMTGKGDYRVTLTETAVEASLILLRGKGVEGR